MADVSKRFGKGLLSTTNTTVYTAPSNKKAIVKAVTICNMGDLDMVFSLRFADTFLAFFHKVKANDTLTVPFLDQILEAGESISASIANVPGKTGTVSGTYYISGREVDV
ncbi:hypothetical protein [Paenibacillus sp. PSB04]|uniref:hypothetical protein n=1 Tax=Paenibacillus sp. PSB04 TaxID=2866810 RepID=UPI0021F1A273|nr:hypothetical protein [Paenibacillus sp. PSB04]UYO04902.1 hypothetical protein K2F33_02530 [Paenibacillus sp. PSB04]